MTKENSESQITPAERALRRQDLSALTEFLWQALKETANLLMKAVAFYLAIMAAILGYVLSHPVAPSIRIVALCTVVVNTLLFTIAVASVGWGLWTGVRDLQAAQEMLSADAVSQLGLPRFFTRARIVFWIIITTSLLISVILLAGIGCSLLR
jgi:hypothetical protein